MEDSVIYNNRSNEVRKELIEFSNYVKTEEFITSSKEIKELLERQIKVKCLYLNALLDHLEFDIEENELGS